MSAEDSFGRRLQQRRRLLDISAEGLAAQASISVHMLRKIERDERRPSREVAALLADALKIAPAERERFLRAARQQAGLGATDRADPAQAGLVQTALMHHPRLIGRAHEEQQLAALLAQPDCRLLTLVGPGGIGKTALALVVAQGQAARLRDGAALVTLAGVGAGALAPLAVAHTFGLNLSGIRPALAEICDELRERELLLVLDNAEHLLVQESDATPLIELVGALLSAAPALKLLVTSRAPLAVRDEWLFDLRGLALPALADTAAGGHEGAAELFLARAQRARPGFAPTTAEAEAIHAICAAVGGAPLGIELAASWLRTLTPHEIAAQMTRDLGQLHSPHRDVPARHRSLRDVFAESWRLLGARERTALAGLSVFQGGCTSAAAEVVAGTTLPVLESLVAKSLARRSHAADRHASRYELHELIRQFAGEQLQADVAVYRAARDRHAAHYLRALQEAGPLLKSERQLEVVSALRTDLDNLWAALNWAISSGQYELIGVDWSARFILLQILGVFVQAEAIGAQLIAAIEPSAQSDRAPRPLALASAAHSLQAITVFRLGRIDAMIRHAQRAVALSDGCDDVVAALQAHLAAGLACAVTGDYARAQWHNEQTVRYVVAVGDPWGSACAAAQLGYSLTLLGRLDEAYATLTVAVAQLRILGEASMYGVAIWYMLSVCLALDHLEEARTLALDGIAALERIGDRRYCALLHDQLGRVYQWMGDDAGALVEHRHAQHLMEQIGSAREAQIAAMHAGYALARLGQASAGIAQIRAALGWLWKAGSVPSVLDALALLADALRTQEDADSLRAIEWLVLVQSHGATLPEMRVWAQRMVRTSAAQLHPAQAAAIQAATAATSLDATIRALVM